MRVLYVDRPLALAAHDEDSSSYESSPYASSICSQSFDSPSPWETKTARESAIEHFAESSDVNHLISYLEQDPERKDALEAVENLAPLRSQLAEASRVRDTHKARLEELRTLVKSYEHVLRDDKRVVVMLQVALDEHIEKIIKLL